MRFSMARGAKRNKVIRMIVQFVAVNVMHMQMNTPTLAPFAAMLACPLVTILYLLAQAFPVGGIVPLGDAALPRGIVGASSRAFCNQGFASGATFDAVLLHGLDDSALADAKLFGYLYKGFRFVDVLGAQPIGIMIELFRAVMPSDVLLPLLIFAYPLDWRAATTGAQRRGAVGLVNRLTGATLASLGMGAPLVSMLFEKVANVTARAVKRFGSFLVRRIVPVGLACPVVVTDRQLLLTCK